MVDLALVRSDMEVVSSDGETVGRIASADGGAFKVMPGGGSLAHDLPRDWISRVDHQVHLRHSAAMLRSSWRGGEPRPFPSEGRARLPWGIGIALLLIALFLLVWGLMYAADSGRDAGDPIPRTSESETAR